MASVSKKNRWCCDPRTRKNGHSSAVGTTDGGDGLCPWVWHFLPVGIQQLLAEYKFSECFAQTQKLCDRLFIPYWQLPPAKQPQRPTATHPAELRSCSIVICSRTTCSSQHLTSLPNKRSGQGLQPALLCHLSCNAARLQLQYQITSAPWGTLLHLYLILKFWNFEFWNFWSTFGSIFGRYLFAHHFQS